MQQNLNPDRREFLGAGLAAIAAPYAFADDKPKATTAFLPRDYKNLAAVPDAQKVLFAAATASGCDAAAYYSYDGRSLTLEKQCRVYPGRKVEFKPITGYDPATYTTAEAVRHHEIYQIPVYAVDREGKPTGTLKGVLALHAQQEGYSRVQSAVEEKRKDDVHEPAYVRQAKLRMATHIAQHFQGVFGDRSGKPLNAMVRNIDDRTSYLMGLVKAQFDTYTTQDGANARSHAEFKPVEAARTAADLRKALRFSAAKIYASDQAPHNLGVTDLMAHTAKALGLPQKQADLLALATLQHDIGKAQLSGKFHEPWTVPKEHPEFKARNDYFMAMNQDHPYETAVIGMPLGGGVGLVSGAHHGAGFMRYSPVELMKQFGSEISKYVLFTKDEPYETLPELSRFMRVADVTEAITGRVDLPMDFALREMASKGGVEFETVKQANGREAPIAKLKPVPYKAATVDANYIPADCICFMLENGVFDAYGKQRDEEEKALGGKGWVDKKGKPKYDPAAVAETKKLIFEAVGWNKEKSDAFRAGLKGKLANDPLLKENPIAPPVPDRGGWGLENRR